MASRTWSPETDGVVGADVIASHRPPGTTLAETWPVPVSSAGQRPVHDQTRVTRLAGHGSLSCPRVMRQPRRRSAALARCLTQYRLAVCLYWGVCRGRLPVGLRLVRRP